MPWPGPCGWPLRRIGNLSFEPPDTGRFPAIKLARDAQAAGGAAPIILNAANEVAVAAFLDRRIGFADIVGTVDRALEMIQAPPPTSIAEVIDIDLEVREKAREIMPLPIR